VGKSYELLDTLEVLGLIPVVKTRTTFVKCGGCKAKLTSRLGIEDLERCKHADVSQFLSDQVSFVFKFLAIFSLLLFMLPIFGLVLALATVMGTFRSRTWPRRLGVVSLVLSSIINAVFFIGIMFVK
jgi:hypothetical protein